MGAKKRNSKEVAIQMERSRKGSPKPVERIWYCPIYKLRGEGFFVEKKNGKYFLGWEDEHKQLKVLISKHVYDVLKNEWKNYE